MIDASVYQMLRGLIVIVVPIQSMIINGTRQYRHHYLGIFLIVSGILFVSIASTNSTQAKSESNTTLGILILISAQFFHGLFFVIEEKILSQYHLDPFKVVGLEGMWGCCYFLTLLPLMQLISCGSIE